MTTRGRRPADGAEQQMREFIGQHLRALRERRGWSQREAARRARMNRQSLALIERGLCFPTWPSTFRIVHACGGTVLELAELVEREFGYLPVDEAAA